MRSPPTAHRLAAVPDRDAVPARIALGNGRLVVLAFAVGLAGCATGRINNPFETAARKPSSQPASENEAREDKAEVVDKGSRETDARKVAGVAGKSPNPSAAPHPKNVSERTSSEVVTAAHTSSLKEGSERGPVEHAAAVATETGRAGPQHATSIDADTLALIDRELRDATPDERAALFQELKSIHPQMVREILRIRRMGLQYREQQRAIAQSAPSATEVVTPASAPSELAHRLPSDPGLGQNPWETGTLRHATARAALGGHTGTVDNDAAPLTRVSESAATATFAPAVEPPLHSATASPAVVGASPPGSPLGQSGVAPTAVGALASGTSASPVPPTGSLSPIQTASASIPADAAPLPEPGRRAALIPGQYDIPPAQGWVAAVPGKAASVAQPVVANVQRALQDLSRPMRPGATPPSAPGAATIPPGDGSPASVTNPGEPAPAPELVHLIDAMERFTASIKPGTTPEEQQFFIEQHVYLRMLYLIASRHERALQAIPGIPAADQEFWQQTLWGIANYFDTEHLPRETDRATQTVAQFATAISRLQQKAQLRIRNTHFCSRIDSYGSYERFDRDEFTPGQPVLLYTEIENFHTEPTADGRHRTLLKSTLEVFRPGPNGELVDRFEFPATEDLCRNPRRDYFHSYEFTIPTKLGLGPHVLKLTLEDQLTRKVATYSVNFSVR